MNQAVYSLQLVVTTCRYFTDSEMFGKVTYDIQPHSILQVDAECYKNTYSMMYFIDKYSGEGTKAVETSTAEHVFFYESRDLR